jgi:hypothetical protein
MNLFRKLFHGRTVETSQLAPQPDRDQVRSADSKWFATRVRTCSSSHRTSSSSTVGEAHRGRHDLDRLSGSIARFASPEFGAV